MRLSEFKDILQEVEELKFKVENGEQVPSHFHITEVGNVDKHFIDCGGTIRKESKISFQLYTANDFDHRLESEKLLSIVELSEKQLQLQDHSIEVEYQNNSIGKYELEFDGDAFILKNTHTDCLAKDNCGIPEKKTTRPLSSLNKEACCGPESNCC